MGLKGGVRFNGDITDKEYSILLQKGAEVFEETRFDILLDKAKPQYLSRHLKGLAKTVTDITDSEYYGNGLTSISDDATVFLREGNDNIKMVLWSKEYGSETLYSDKAGIDKLYSRLRDFLSENLPKSE